MTGVQTCALPISEKRAIETARYVIPIAAFTSMVHTVSGIVLHRLQRMVNTGDTPHEAREVIGEMVRLVREWDPLFFEKVGLGAIDSGDLPEGRFPQPHGDVLHVLPARTPVRALVVYAQSVAMISGLGYPIRLSGFIDPTECYEYYRDPVFRVA